MDSCFDARIELNPPAQVKNREHCSVDPEKLVAIGRDQGQQVRIKRNSNEYAIYTVRKEQQEDPGNSENTVRMTLDGLKKLGINNSNEVPVNAIVEAKVPYMSCLNNQSCISDTDARAISEFIEHLDDNGTNKDLVIIAPHGGAIEVKSDTIAEEVSDRLVAIGKNVSYWRCKGWKQGGGAYQRWHITSIDIHQASFPLLNTIINRSFNYAVSFHGFNKSKRPVEKQHVDIWIGGGASYPLKAEMGNLIGNQTGLKVVVSGDLGEDDPFSGTSKKNIVNRLALNNNGIQIEI
ncbi:poly-gamma-glutamate hydrolase family protein [Moorena producens JHB]|uniref:Poly-gamma-glutamate hydrolase family protein n=1 Tax=Moorena producens (strain JHB) TaxID=1454205 RepID=A0A1D9G7A8_MOOP1|nr:poly-gamma-glutamate hydrolase family protein [Moorena producens]AOY83529.1 poly-gamma-glutamate hydrolase family protein [Moorena producens JHB]